VSDVAQALLVPRVDARFDVGGLYSALLVWDRILLPETDLVGPSTPVGREVLAQFSNEGAVVWLDLVDMPPVEGSVQSAFQFIEEVSDHFPPGLDEGSKGFLTGMLVSGAAVGERQGHAIQQSVALCEQMNAAPLATGSVSLLAAGLPGKQDADLGRSGRLISAALQCVAVPPETAPEAVLRFRDEHSALRGRFRAAIVDLAEALTADVPPAAALERARATVANRVEPLLGDLESALSENRITYLWRTLTAGAAVASAPVTPAVAASGAATFVTHSLAYAFSRKQLVARHPFGLLLEARRTFSGTAGGLPPVWRPRTIVDPAAELRELWATAIVKALNKSGPSANASLEEWTQSLGRALSEAFRELEEGQSHG
jgi:hypothetical protein